MNISASFGAPRSRTTFMVAMVTAGMFTLMLVAQLYGFEDLSTILSGVLSSNDSSFHATAAGFLVLAELISLPFLLGMYLSTLMRVLSAAAGFGVAWFWLLLALTNAHTENSGLFSSAITLPGGVLNALWAFVLFVCVCRVIYADSRFRHAGS